MALLEWAEQADGKASGDAPTAAFLPPAKLYVHLSQETFLRQCRGAARVEGVGAVTVEQAVDLLRHCNVTLRGVVDLNDAPSVDGYEVSPLVRETVELRHPVEVFPHGTLSSRKADKDHTVPFVPPDEGGPPGQTTPDNLGPLGRYHHRLKTHGDWRCTQPERGVFLWRSPHGHWARVDATGTHYLGRLPVAGTVVEQHFRLILAA